MPQHAPPRPGNAGSAIGNLRAVKIRLGHSPDSDDAFMFWGLASGAVQTNLEFEHILKDIQTLNEWAMEGGGRLETTAVSVHCYAHIADRYELLRHGGSFGDGYGPMIISREPIRPEELAGKTIAVPGLMTSAFLQLQIWWKETLGSSLTEGADLKVVAFDQIIPAVKGGEADAGVIIHEGQLTWKQEGVHKVADFGQWWRDRTGGLPLPLGVNVVRRDLPDAIRAEIDRCMEESISLGLANREEALAYALGFARGMDPSTSDEFVGMYVNDRTRDMGEEGLEAIHRLLDEGAELGVVPRVDIPLAHPGKR